MWGVNYDHDAGGRLLEDYWDDEWDTVAQDFREIKALGANVVRVHLQTRPVHDRPPTSRTRRTSTAWRSWSKLAEETGLYLDVTGLGCYHKQDVPAWYDDLEESARWDVQARFWKAVAGGLQGQPRHLLLRPDERADPHRRRRQERSGSPASLWAASTSSSGSRSTCAGRTDKEIAAAWVEQADRGHPRGRRPHT